MNIFCKVIDNFGDAGFCLRLARDLAGYNLTVRIFCDNLEAISRITTAEDRKNQLLSFLPWPHTANEYQTDHIVIELFSCRLDPFLIDQIKKDKSLLIAMDYFCCEPWIDGFHLKPSFSEQVESFFFFPGISPESGGIIIEDSFKQKILNNNDIYNKTFKISLFSYFNSYLYRLITNCFNSNLNFEFTVFEGKTLDNINALFHLKLKVNEIYKINNLVFKVSPMVSQAEYDRILLNSDFNFVRGEDSAVRAMLVGKPFLWQIYPQDGDTHLSKLNSLFDRMHEYLDPDLSCSIEKIRKFNLQYVDTEAKYIASPFLLEEFCKEHHKTFAAWSAYLLSLPSLTKKLISFIKQHLDNI